MTTQQEDYVPNKAHQVEHKTISDGTFYGVVIKLAKEFKDGWVLSEKDYPVWNGIMFTIGLKRDKSDVQGVGDTNVPETVKTAPKQATVKKTTPSARRARSVKPVVTVKANN